MKFLSLTRILAIVKKEFNHLRRDHLTGGMVAGFPIVLTILFGYAINNDVRYLNAIVVDEANTSASRQLLLEIKASQVVDIIAEASSPKQMEEIISSGKASVGIYIPTDFEERLARKQFPLSQLLIDDSDPTIFRTARGLANLPITANSQLQNNSIFETHALYNPERRSALFIVPGLCGVILTLTMVLFTSVAIVKERERGNLEVIDYYTDPIR